MTFDFVKSPKKQLIDKLQRPYTRQQDPLFTQIHAIDIKMNFSNAALRGWISEKLSAHQCPVYVSPEFEKLLDTHHLSIHWIDVDDIEPGLTKDFCEDPNDELEILCLENEEWAFQRDFVGSLNERHINIYCPLHWDDSFFNALRWFLPRHLLEFNSLVLHSSCFVNKNGWAHLFIGPSGIGKTTTVTRIMGHTILGDDMILLSFADGKVFAETPVLGQNPRFKGCQGQKFPVQAFHFLQQGSCVQKNSISRLESHLRFTASILYPTWSYEPLNRVLKIKTLVETFLQIVPSDELTLDLSSPFLGVIDECYK